MSFYPDNTLLQPIPAFLLTLDQKLPLVLLYFQDIEETQQATSNRVIVLKLISARIY